MVRTKKVSRNNSKNKVGGVSPSRRASRSPSRSASRSTSSRASRSPSRSVGDEKVVIISAVKDVPSYFTESDEQVKKLLTVGNRIKKLTLKFRDDSPSEIYELNESFDHDEFEKKFTEHANLAGDTDLKGITVTIDIENNFTRKDTKKKSMPLVSNKGDNDIFKKIRLLVNKALIINQESTSTLTLSNDEIKTYPKIRDFKFYFNSHAKFNVTTVSKDKYYQIVKDLGPRSNINSNSNSPHSAKSDPGPRSPNKKRSSTFSTRSAE